MSLIKSIQQVSITIGTGAVSNTATITGVTTGNSLLIFDGWTSNSSTQVASVDIPSAVLTNTTTVTAQRNSSSGSFAIVVNATIIEFYSSAIQSMQPFSISMSTGSATATISAVVLANSAVVYNGFTSTDASNDSSVLFTDLSLTNTTTVTATNNTSGNGIIVKGTVIEFQAGVLNSSTQQGAVSLTTAQTTNTAAISNVTVSQSMLVYGGVKGAGSTNFEDVLPYGILTNGTTVTATRGFTGSGAGNLNFTVLEFKAADIKSVNRGTIAIGSGATTNTATFTAVNTSFAFVNYVGGEFNNSGSVGPGKYFGRLDLTNTTTATGSRGVSDTNTVTLGFEVIEFTNVDNGTAAITEQNDSTVATGLLTFTGTTAVTEQGDSTVATGLSGIRGSTAVTEANDLTVASGLETIKGTTAVTEGNDTCAPATGTATGDGSATAANSNSVTLSTTKTNDIILLFIAGESNNPVASVSDTAGLTWNKACPTVSANNGASITVGDLFWAYSSGILTNDSISVSRTGGDGRLMAMAINGANTTTPLDVNVSNPGTNSTLNATNVNSVVSTTNAANTMLVAWAREYQGQGNTLSSAPSGFSSVLGGGSFTWLYSKNLSATQSSVTESFTFSGNLYSVMILVAIQSAASPNGLVTMTGITSLTEQNDSDVATGLAGIRGSIAVTEQNDSTVATGTEVFTGTSATTEQNDSEVASGLAGIRGSTAVTETNDSDVATGLETMTGALAVTEQSDSTVGAGLAGIRGLLSATEQGDSTISTGLAGIRGAVAVTEQSDSPVSTGAEIFTGHLLIYEQDDSVVSVGLEKAIGVAAITEQSDATSAGGYISPVGSAAITEQSDSVVGHGLEKITGALAVTEANDSAVASGLETIKGSAAPHEGNDSVAASGVEVMRGTAAITEQPDHSTAHGREIFTGTGAATEDSDIMTASGHSWFAGTAGITEQNDSVVARGIAVIRVAHITRLNVIHDINYLEIELAQPSICAVLDKIYLNVTIAV